jgi:hypothetical protein
MRAFSARSYGVTASFLVIFLPALHFLLRDHKRVGERVRWVTPLVTALFCWPAGVNGRSYFSWKDPGMPMPQEVWWPEAWKTLPDFPGEAWFFGGLFALSVGAAQRWGGRHRRLAIALAALVVVETFLHVSFRSPYTYVPHHEFPLSQHY